MELEVGHMHWGTARGARGGEDKLRALDWGPKKLTQTLICTKFFDNPSGRGRPRRKSWTSAPKSAFSCGPGGGEKLLTPGHPGVRVRRCPWEFRTKKFMFIFFASLIDAAF